MFFSKANVNLTKTMNLVEKCLNIFCLYCLSQGEFLGHPEKHCQCQKCTIKQVRCCQAPVDSLDSKVHTESDKVVKNVNPFGVLNVLMLGVKVF